METAAVLGDEEQEDVKIDAGAEIQEKEKIIRDEIAQNELDLNQCDEFSGRYNREFLFNIRDLEKLLYVTPCPIEQSQLKKLGVCPSIEQTLGPQLGWEELMKKKRELKIRDRKAWLKLKAPRVIPVPLRKLHKAVNPWRVEEITEIDGESKSKLLIRKVRAIFNKVTPTTYEPLKDELLLYKVYRSPALNEIVAIIFDLAIADPRFDKLFSQICLDQIQDEVKNSEESIFQNALFSHAEEIFKRMNMENFLKGKEASIDTEINGKESEERKLILKEKRIGIISLIAHFYLIDIMNNRPVIFCLSLLQTVAKPPDVSVITNEESIYLNLRLLKMVGKRLHEENLAAVAQGGQEVFPFDALFKILEEAALRFNDRVKYMILNLVELREKGWVARKSPNEPKKLNLEKREAERELRKALEAQAAAEVEQKREEKKDMGEKIIRDRIAVREQDLDQCDETIGRYNREFLYSIKALEKLLSITACPVDKTQLKIFGIFSTKNKYKLVDREERKEQYEQILRDMKMQRKIEKGKKTIPPPDMLQDDQLLKELHKAPQPWRVETINEGTEEGKKKLLIRKVRAIFNKVTLTTYESLKDELLLYKIDQSPALNEIISIFFDLAIADPRLDKLFSQICLDQITDELKNCKVSIFHNALLSHTQEIIKNTDMDNFLKGKEASIETEVGDKRREERQLQLKDKRIGFMLLITHFYLMGIMSNRLIHSCLFHLSETVSKHLNGISTNEESVHLKLRLLKMVGKRLDEENLAAVAQGGQEIFPFDSLFAMLKRAAPRFGNSVKFMMMHLVELRENGWIPRKTYADLEKIDKEKRDAERELKKAKAAAKGTQKKERTEQMNVKKGRTEEMERDWTRKSRIELEDEAAAATVKLQRREARKERKEKIRQYEMERTEKMDKPVWIRGEKSQAAVEAAEKQKKRQEQVEREKERQLEKENNRERIAMNRKAKDEQDLQAQRAQGGQHSRREGLVGGSQGVKGGKEGVKERRNDRIIYSSVAKQSQMGRPQGLKGGEKGVNGGEKGVKERCKVGSINNGLKQVHKPAAALKHASSSETKDKSSIEKRK